MLKRRHDAGGASRALGPEGRPDVAPDYAKRCQELAVKIGLGRKPGVADASSGASAEGQAVACEERRLILRLTCRLPIICASRSGSRN